MGPAGKGVLLCLSALAVAETEGGLTADMILPKGAGCWCTSAETAGCWGMSAGAAGCRDSSAGAAVAEVLGAGALLWPAGGS